LRERIELDLEARLMGETLVLNISLDHFLEDYIELNDLNKPFELRRNQGDDLMPTIKEGEFHNSIMKDKMVYNGNTVVGTLMNIPIFVGTFSVMTNFVVLENMDAYHDEGMGDVIFGEPFLREVEIKARRFDGMITIYNGDDEDLVKEISTNIGGEFKYLEILKCWSLETSSSQSSCDFTTITINGESEERRTTEGIVRNYYDREVGETTPIFEE
ncbi:hypothetical protein Tco_0435604, partial [Tanacetum coccineum]